MLELNMAGKHSKKVIGVINSYAEFETFANETAAVSLTSPSILNTSSTKDNSYIAISLDPANPGTGANYGSPWGSQTWHSSNAFRVAQHAMPTLEAWNEVSASKRTVLIKIGTRVYKTGGWASVTRNGFTSGAYTSYTSGWPVLDIIYWDEVNGTVMRSNPNAREAVGKIFDGILK